MSSFSNEAFALLGVGLGIFGLRMYIRIEAVGARGLAWDDFLMCAAAILYSAETALAYSVGAYWHGLANNGMTPEARKALDPSSLEYHMRVNGSKTQVAGWSVYTTLLWTLKGAMCAYYLRLTDGLRDYRPRIIAGFGIIFATWIIVLLSILLGCRPLPRYWQIHPDPGNSCQPAISKINLFVTVVLNGLSDIYLLSIPMPMLFSVRLPTAKRLGLSALFSGGIFVMIAGTLRCVLIVTNPVTGAEQAGYWAVRETFVAVATTNLPVVFPFLRKQLTPILGSISSSNRSANATSKRTNPLPGSIRLNDMPTVTSEAAFNKKGVSVTQYPVPSENYSNESPPHGGIRKETEVKMFEEHVGSSPGPSNSLHGKSRIIGPNESFGSWSTDDQGKL